MLATVPPPRAILADLDGTLIDSRASVIAAFCWWGEARGLDPEWVAKSIPFGRTSTDAVRVLDPSADAERDGALLDRRQQEDAAGVVALPGALELLEQQHWPLAIVTSCPRPLALARLQAARLPVPDALVTPELWRHGKPDPEPYLLGARVLGMAAEACVVLEDAPSGVQSGVAAGMPVIGVLSTLTPAELPLATACVQDVSEVPAVLARWSTRPPVAPRKAGPS